MKNKSIVSLVFLSLGISLCALGVAFYRNSPLGFDTASFIVGVLSLLVTVLIGWQILNVLFIREEMKSTANKEIEKSVLDFNLIFNGYIKTLSDKGYFLGNRVDALDVYMDALSDIVKSSKSIIANQAIAYMMEYVVDIKNDMCKYNQKGILSGRKEFYIEVLSKTNHKDAKDIIDFLTEAEEIPDSKEWLRREGRLAED